MVCIHFARLIDRSEFEIIKVSSEVFLEAAIWPTDRLGMRRVEASPSHRKVLANQTWPSRSEHECLELKENQSHFGHFSQLTRSLSMERNRLKFWPEMYFNSAPGCFIYSFLAADPLTRILQSSSTDCCIPPCMH